MPDKDPKDKKGRKGRSDLAKYSDIAIKMAGIIFLGVWGGMKLEAYFGFEQPILTVFTSLASVFLAIYIVIRDIG
jgi:hypothetical protein